MNVLGFEEFHNAKEAKMNGSSKVSGVSGSFLFGAAYAYLCLPILVFMFGWFRLPLAVLSAAAVAVGFFCAVKDAPPAKIPRCTRENVARIALISVVAVLWVLFSGIGGFSFQNGDHSYRNAILKMLVEKDWPVVITDTAPHFARPVAMVYYFAFWLPAACVGKFLGLAAAHLFLFVWTVIGVLLVFYFVLAYTRRRSVFVVVAFIFFSGLDVIGYGMLEVIRKGNWSGGALLISHMEWWAKSFQYSAFTTQLYWVFNQALPAWLITLLILHQKNCRSLAFLFSFALLFCTLPAAGLVPVAMYVFVRRCRDLRVKGESAGRNALFVAKDVLTVQNVLAGGIIGITSFLFLKINASGNHIAFAFRDFDFKLLMRFGAFIFLEAIVYYLAIFRSQSKNGLLYVSLVSLVCIPLVQVGYGADFCMRASIPSLVVLFLLVVTTLCQCRERGKNLNAVVLCVLLFLGSFTAQHEMLRSLAHTAFGRTTAKEIDLFQDWARRNFFGEYEDSAFFKYIAK